ncbi:unnamed protein product, partial [Rotaria sordida]
MAATQLAATFTNPLQVVPIVNTIINGIFTVYGTGDPQLNFGHQCLCKMTWNKERHVFE